MKKLGLTGQSNGVGSGSGGPWGISSRVVAWDCAPNRDDLLNLGTAFMPCVMGQNPFFTNGGIAMNNQGAHWANHVSDLMDEDVQLAVCCRSAQSIDMWHDGTTHGPMMERFDAILGAAGMKPLDALLWNQGSNDHLTAATYKARFDAMAAEMISRGMIQSETPIIVCEVDPGHNAINPVLEEIANSSPHYGIARMMHLPTVDTVHFTGSSLAMAGWEAAVALSKTVGPFNGIVPATTDGLVFATGYTELSFAAGGQAFIPLSARYGKLDLVDGGSFVSDRPGLWHIEARVYTGGSSTRLRFMDDTGGLLVQAGYTGNMDVANSAIQSGFNVFNLPTGKRIKLHAKNDGQNASTVESDKAALYIAMTARHLGYA